MARPYYLNALCCTLLYLSVLNADGSPARIVLRACMHDPEVFPDPDRFLPDRFMRDGKLDTSIRDPSDFIFGYGRR